MELHSTQHSIGVPDGKIRYDSVLSCYLLKTVPEFSKYVIIRSRVPEILEQCTILACVGGINDHRQLRYDHHEFSNFNQTKRENEYFDLPLPNRPTSAAVIYYYYAHRIIPSILGLIDEIEQKIVIREVYQRFFKEWKTNGLHKRVEFFNPHWNEEERVVTSAKLHLKFLAAINLVGSEFEDLVKYVHKAWLPAGAHVNRSMETRREIHKSGLILLLEPHALPYERHLYSIERREGCNKLLFVIYEEPWSSYCPWRVNAIKHDGQQRPQTLISKKAQEKQQWEQRNEKFRELLPNNWHGLKDRDLEEKSGIMGAVFVHRKGHTGGAMTKQAVVLMAQKGLQRKPVNNAQRRARKQENDSYDTVAAWIGKRLDLSLYDLNEERYNEIGGWRKSFKEWPDVYVETTRLNETKSQWEPICDNSYPLLEKAEKLRDGKRISMLSFIPGKFVPISLFHCDEPARSDAQWYLLVLVVHTGLPHIQQNSIPLPFFGCDGESELNKFGLLNTVFVHFTMMQEDCVHSRVKLALQRLRYSHETNPKMWHKMLMTAAREGQKEAIKLEKRAENRGKCIIS